MTVGYTVNKQTIDNRVGQLVQTLRETLDGVARAKAYLDALPDGDLQTLGYNPTDITALRASMTDLANLRATALGQRAQSPASNFFFNADKLTGIV